MTTSARIALVCVLIVAGCGAPEEPPQPPPSTSAQDSQTAAPDKPAEMPAAPPNTVGPAATPPPAPAKPQAPPAKPAYTRTDLTAGTGTVAQKGKNISVHYTGWLYDPAKPGMKGRLFDSSQERGPFTFQLGAGQVIPGWDQGFDGMKVGGRRRLIIPPSLGYGVDGAGGGIIPPNATLLFEMELLEVK
jgi:FKBP-type peptidyl-prolyl cis-trans isomerase FkpA